MIRKQFLVYSLAAGCTTQPRICTHQTLQKDSANTIFVHDAFMYTNCKELHSSSRHANQKKRKTASATYIIKCHLARVAFQTLLVW